MQPLSPVLDHRGSKLDSRAVLDDGMTDFERAIKRFFERIARGGRRKAHPCAVFLIVVHMARRGRDSW